MSFSWFQFCGLKMSHKCRPSLRRKAYSVRHIGPWLKEAWGTSVWQEKGKKLCGMKKAAAMR